MNIRQKNKHMKKQINRLKSDNDLMRRIIADNPRMQELYEFYNKPLNVTHTTMSFQKYQTKRFLPPNRPYNAEFIALFKNEMVKDFFDAIKDNIVFELDTECMTPTIIASIFIGMKEGE